MVDGGQNFDKICQKQGIYQRAAIYQQMEGGARTFVFSLADFSTVQCKTLDKQPKECKAVQNSSAKQCKKMQNSAVTMQNVQFGR